MSDNTLVIQSINGSLNVSITSMEMVVGSLGTKEFILREVLEDVRINSKSHRMLVDKESLLFLGYTLNRIVSKLEVAK